LRTILNSYDCLPRVVATRGEFDSIDLILRQYALRGRIRLRLVEPREHGLFESADVLDAIGAGADLVVVSHILFNTVQVFPRLAEIIAAAHDAGARVLVDVYHSLGVVPVDIESLDADFAIGGSYKYLRGGPGAAYLYLHPRHLDGRMKPLDIGWFAKKDVFQYRRPDPPEFGAGGDAFLESTPPVLTYYQARAGQLFTLGVGVDRLREYSLEQLRRLISLLETHGIAATGGSDDRGAFVVVSFEGRADGEATRCARALGARGVVCDARGPWLRLCPDVLTRAAEIDRAAETVAEVTRA
jgi:kynureninase